MKEAIYRLEQLSSYQDAMKIVRTFNFFAGKSVAAVTGGCIRSVLTGKTVKDIDIVIQMTDKDVEEAYVLAARMGYIVVVHQSGAYESTDTLVDVMKLHKPNAEPIELLFINCSIEERIAAHSANCSNVWIELDRHDVPHLHTLPDFSKFLRERTIQHYINSPQYSELYKRRLEQYYPEYTHITKETNHV